MNIIANDCAGAYIYKDCIRCDFMNPFIWSSIDIDNFLKLIKNYDELNFRNIKCELIENNSGICKNKSMIPRITIDDSVNIHYFHYIQNDKYSTPTKVEGYTMYKDIITYTIDCYIRRLNKTKEQPIFIWDVTKAIWYNKNRIDPFESFNNIKSNYNIIIYSPTVKSETKSNIILLNKSNGDFEVNVSGSNIYNKVLKNYER
jgi:hypothetical protein